MSPSISVENCRGEFRYLRQVYHEIDLNGPPIQTDGWSGNVAQAEWPFMGLVYHGYSCANLAQFDPHSKTEALVELKWVIGALQTPRLTGFVAPHFGEPFGDPKSRPAVFVHGHWLNLAVKYRKISGDMSFDPLIQAIASRLHRGFLEAPEGILPSYPDMYWLTDNFAALAALQRYDQIFGSKLGRVKVDALSSIKRRFLDADTGMLSTYVDPKGGRSLQGPRGVAQMYGLHFLWDFDALFAREQYERAQTHLILNSHGVAAVREFPKGVEGRPDIDSGPVIFGLGASASGFALAAAVNAEDWKTVEGLLQALNGVGGAAWEGDRLRFTRMPAVGQAVILYGKTLLLKPSSQ
ncbi:MAG TPA: hypothetical protein VK968_11740 [Roseimicrobium sp.]|nr:hypothetical protein [Roseimicrobium sp.]